ncbi:MAG: hypothetical protein Q7T48_17235 [Cellvibrio sp.]|uniref:tetratricopeptide repeat protein n=1 Tax=Cellvibrio sp. TaxID=1965322 RepID=UPI00271F6608|nr:hypothetical protein [Cellvibrio sp.]
MDAYGVAYYLGECDADEFLIELAKELQCFPPTLFSDPYGHLLNELEPVAEFPLTKSESSDILTSLKNELIESQQRFNTDQKIPELMMKGEWDKVIKLSDESNPAHLNNLAWAYTMQGNELFREARFKKHEQLFQECLGKYKKAVEINPNMNEAFNNWAYALYELALIKNDETIFQLSCDKCQQATAINPNMHEAFNNWGNALSNIAKLNGDEPVFLKSFEKYQQAINIKSDMYEAFSNWGSALSELAKLKADEVILLEGLDKFQEAAKIRPDDYETLNNWGNALLLGYELFKKTQFLNQAQDILTSAEKLDADHVYNLACLYSRINGKDKCKEKLLRCRDAKTLPNKAHLRDDKDLENVRNEPWFEELINSID